MLIFLLRLLNSQRREVPVKKRTPFNWSLLDRNILYSMLYKLGPQLIGKELEIPVLHSILATHIKKHLPIKVVRVHELITESKLVYTGGTYYSDNDQEHRRQLEIVFSYHTTDKTIKITRYRWQRMCQLFADTMLHEIIHMRQYRSREFKQLDGYESTAQMAKQRKDQSYYGHPDELGAYAFNIACELFDKFGNDLQSIKHYLDSNLAIRKKKTCYYRYLLAFECNHQHIIIKKLKRKILVQLKNAATGKPFKTTNHLTY